MKPQLKLTEIKYKYIITWKLYSQSSIWPKKKTEKPTTLKLRKFQLWAFILYSQLLITLIS